MRDITYAHFGLAADPWPSLVATADAKRTALAVAGALRRNAMVAIVGSRGSGKTVGAWHALNDHEHRVVEPLRLDRNRLHIGDITSAIVAQLSDETPRHSGEDRSAQALRVLRAAGPVALVIDDAHLLHHQTLRAIKRLRELGARGRRSALLPVILLGQHDPTERVAEVGLRTDTLVLPGLTRAEAADIVAGVCGHCLGRGVLDQIVAAGRGNWLDLQRVVDSSLAQAMAAGEKKVAQVAGAVAEDGEVQPAPAAPAPGQVAAALGGGRRRSAVA